MPLPPTTSEIEMLEHIHEKLSEITEHRHNTISDMLDDLASRFMLSEVDICALFRQLFNAPISNEGTSGPRLHDLLRRLQKHVGPEIYNEMVEGEWPKRLK